MPRVVVFDSGVGGVSILRALRRRIGTAARFDYVADTAWFPYGPKAEGAVADRVCAVIGTVMEHQQVPPKVVVIACNTASTAALSLLRQRFPDCAFVGVVPAIKPAAVMSQSKVIGLLATPGTVRRPYSDGLIRDFATDCVVVRHGAENLAALAEQVLSGKAVDEAAIRAEIIPLFDTPRLDTVVLGCTHYPLVLPLLQQVAPWPVQWVDSAAAVARQTARLLAAESTAGTFRQRRQAAEAGGAEDGVQDEPDRLWVTALKGGIVAAGDELPAPCLLAVDHPSSVPQACAGAL